jgi:hypothetical protein
VILRFLVEIAAESPWISIESRIDEPFVDSAEVVRQCGFADLRERGYQELDFVYFEQMVENRFKAANVDLAPGCDDVPDDPIGLA